MKSLLAFFSNNHGLSIGQPAPKIQAVDQDNQIVDLGSAYEQGPVFFYFYVRANTPVCTAHTCQVRDRFTDLQKLGVQVFGVSSDPPERLKKFHEKHHLPFSLLADTKHEIANGFHVPTLLSFPARDAYLVCNSLIAWKGHASDPISKFTHLLQS